MFLKKSASSAVSDFFRECIGSGEADSGSLAGGAVFLKKSAKSAAEDRLRGEETASISASFARFGIGSGSVTESTCLVRSASELAAVDARNTFCSSRESAGLARDGAMGRPSTGIRLGPVGLVLADLIRTGAGDAPRACSPQGGSDLNISAKLDFRGDIESTGRCSFSTVSLRSSLSLGIIFAAGRLAEVGIPDEMEGFCSLLLLDRENVELCRPSGELFGVSLLLRLPAPAAGGEELTRDR